MSLPLPNVGKVTYSDAYLSTLSPTERHSLYWGVEKQFLYLASKEYLEAQDEQYGIHNYKTLHATNAHAKLLVDHETQFKNALELLGSGHLWCDPASIIVLNSQDYLLEGRAKDAVRGVDGFLAHLLCSLAYRAITRKCPRVEVNYLETMALDHNKGYKMEERQVLIWGPITDHFNSFEYNKTVQFLYTFRHHTRILLTCTPDIGELLAKLKVNIDRVSYFFNFSACKEEVKPSHTQKSRVGRKKKDPVALHRSL